MNKVSSRRLARGFVSNLANGKDPKQLINMLAAEIIESKQVGNMDIILSEISREMESQMNVANAKVYSAHEMSTAVKSQVAKLIKEASGTNKVNIDEQIDPSLLGGVKIETPEREIDLSVKKKLESIGGSK